MERVCMMILLNGFFDYGGDRSWSSRPVRFFAN